MVNPVLQNVCEGVRDLTPYQPGRSAEDVAAERGLSDVVKLASNENPLGPCRAALRAIHKLPPATVSRYPDGSCDALCAAVAARLRVSPRRIIFGNGSNEILELAAQLVLSENSAAVISRHAFAVYGLATVARRARPIFVAAAENYSHDLDAMARAAADRNVRLMFIANPNNPTGSWHPPKKIAALMARVPPHVLVVLDEAYREYVDGKDKLEVGGFPNLLITRTFSKIHGLAGLRIGFGIGNADLIAMLHQIRQPFNLGGAAQAAALAALANDAHIARSITTNAKGMLQIRTRLDKMKIRRLPSRANFITFCADTAKNAAHMYEGLLDFGVVVRPLTDYGMPEWLRVSVGLQSENRRFLSALAKLWK